MECSIVSRSSDYKRIIAVISRVIFLVCRWRLTRPPKDECTFNTSLSNCLCSTRTAVIRIFQSHAYQQELDALRLSKPLPEGSSLQSLDPFINEEGILRVTGRIQNSSFSYAKKHPIVLPKSCHFIAIYVDYIHCSFCHANKEFVIQFILAEFFLVGRLTKLVKARLRKCVICIRFKATSYNQIIDRLPSARVNISHPFTHVGVDFCGPFNCKCLAHQSTKFTKIYACVFVCMVMRVHIETASDLSSTVFLMTLPLLRFTQIKEQTLSEQRTTSTSPKIRSNNLRECNKSSGTSIHPERLIEADSGRLLSRPQKPT